MASLTIKIDSENEAFSDGNAGAEIARLLRKTADKIEAGCAGGCLMDINGNRVGSWDCDLGDNEDGYSEEAERGRS
jgi:hypothetical protein